METKAIQVMVMTVIPFVIQGCTPLKVPVIAHRGASFLAAENTLSAVKLAWEIGADAVEIDVRMTSDEQIVLMHDQTTKRTTGENLVVSQTSSDQLRSLKVGKPWNRDSRDEPIPFLEDVLQTIPEGGRLFIEVKTGPEIVIPLTRLLETYPNKERLVVIGFEFETISKIKESNPWLTTYWLLGPSVRKALRKDPEHFIQTARSANLDGLNVHASLADEKLQKLTQKMNLHFLVWVVNHSKAALNLSNRGVNGITTDRPEIFSQKD